MRFLISIGLLFTTTLIVQAEQPPRQILMIAGPPSHGFGAHEHYAGLRILADEVDGDDAVATVTRGWPDDASIIDAADCIVFFADGGGRHPALPHMDELAKKMAAGCGLVAIHYATETVPGPQGDRWLSWMGGHFEINRSVNPHWIANIQPNPNHPISAGFRTFQTNDEWYFYLRFAENGVTPILQAIAPEETMRRQDGPHEGNPEVRKSVAAGELQTLAWTYDRGQGNGSQGSGRSFGITGGHYHWVWGDPSMRTITSQGIRWAANLPVELPSDAAQVTESLLFENQDEPVPANFEKSVIDEYLP